MCHAVEGIVLGKGSLGCSVEFGEMISSNLQCKQTYWYWLLGKWYMGKNNQTIRNTGLYLNIVLKLVRFLHGGFVFYGMALNVHEVNYKKH